jgi:2-methylcitrate dehydratase
VSSHIARPAQEFDKEIVDIVDYALSYQINSDVAYETAWNCLMDTIGCGLEALDTMPAPNLWDHLFQASL